MSDSRAKNTGLTTSDGTSGQLTTWSQFQVQARTAFGLFSKSVKDTLTEICNDPWEHRGEIAGVSTATGLCIAILLDPPPHLIAGLPYTYSLSVYLQVILFYSAFIGFMVDSPCLRYTR